MDQTPKVIEAKFRTHCHDCGARIEVGDLMWWRMGTRAVYGEACGCGPKRRAEAQAAGRFGDDRWPQANPKADPGSSS
jgi:hypothetical protein